VARGLLAMGARWVVDVEAKEAKLSHGN
jgi:hypothetical protein